MSRASPQFDAFALADRDAVALLQRAEPVARTDFESLSTTARAHAFTAAGLESDAAVEAVHAEIGRALREGTTFAEFRRNLADRFERGGDGPSSAFRAEFTFRHNLSRAHAASRRRALAEPAVAEAFPYLLYSAVGDSRTRPSHAALDGKVLRRDDPFWDRYSPPWEYGCRCQAIPLTARQAARMGVAIEPVGELAESMAGRGLAPSPGLESGPADAAFGSAAPRDPSWSRYEPGRGGSAVDPADLGVPPVGQRRPAPAAAPMPTARQLASGGLSRRDQGEQLARELAGRLAAPPDGVAQLTDAAGRTVGVAPARAADIKRDGREAWLGSLPDVLSEPDEIWLAEWADPATGDVQLRRHYLKLLSPGEGGAARVAVATVRRGDWTDWDLLAPSASRRLAAYRRGAIVRVR
jgi:SPP1 gp7 family putative phage head morphogenesis protein